jgi:hypothetical protein
MARSSSSKASDPSVRHLKGAAPEYPEGTHPIAPVSEQTWGPDRFSYSELPDEQKPDPTSVVQQFDGDPLEDEKQEALKKDAESAVPESERRESAGE